MDLLQARERRAHRKHRDGWCCFAVRAFYLLEVPDATLNDQNTDFCTARVRSMVTACARVKACRIPRLHAHRIQSRFPNVALLHNW